MSCTNTAQAGTSALPNDMSGAATPNPVTLGNNVTLAGATFGINVPPTVLLAGYGLNLLTVGLNTIPADVNLTLAGSNTSQATQAIGPLSVTGTTTITDPTPANKTSGDESATPLSVSAPLPTTTWTPTGGNVAFTIAASDTTALVGPGGIIAVTFTCVPGVPGPAGCGAAPLPPCTNTIPQAAIPFDTVTVNAPPTAPVCTPESISVGAGQSATVNLNDNCTDVNGNINPSTWNVSALTPASPAGGTLTASATPGVYDYTAPANDPGPVTFTFSVSDTGGLASNTATGTISVLANQCTATTGACSLTEIVVQPVIGAAMTFDKAPGQVVMSPVVLNGQAQVSLGGIQQVTVTNARGTGTPWNVTGYVTDLGIPGLTPTVTLGGQTFPACSAAGSAGLQATPNRNCIPGDNLGWRPFAAVAHNRIAGDVATVNAGAEMASGPEAWLAQLVTAGAAAAAPGTPPPTVPGVDGLGGLQTQNNLCGAPVDQSGGTFNCNATLFLGIPASAGAGNYAGGLVLTLL